jgi:hypothetical protein
MDEILAQLFPQAPSYFPGLLGQEQANLLQQQAQRQGLLGIGMGLLQAAAPSTTRPSLGAGIAQGLATGQQMAQNVYAQRLQEAQIAQKLAEQQRLMREQEVARTLLPQILRPGEQTPTFYGQPTTFPQRDEEGNILPGAGVQTGQPQINFNTMQALLTQAPGAAAQILPIVEAYRKMSAPERVTLKKGETILEQTPFGLRPVAGGAEPEYREVGGALYEMVPGQAPKVVINPSGKLTGDYANVSMGLFGTSDVAQLPSGGWQQIQDQVLANKRAGAGQTPITVYPPGAVAPGTSAQNKIDEALLGSGSRLQVLNRISEAYRPEFLQTRFKVAQGLVELGEKLGREPNPEERQNLEQFSRFRQDAVRQLNQYINEITGAAIGQGEEAERLKSGVPNPGTGLFGGDSPTVFLSKLNNTVRDLRLAEARLQYIKTKGFNIQDVALDDMPTIMRKRKEQIVKDFGLDEARSEDREVLKNRLAAEFGLLR